MELCVPLVLNLGAQQRCVPGPQQMLGEMETESHPVSSISQSRAHACAHTLTRAPSNVYFYKLLCELVGAYNTSPAYDRGAPVFHADGLIIRG